MRNFLQELKRRHVYNVATAYLAVGWLLIEVASTLFDIFGFPETHVRVVAILVFVGFPLAMILAWVYDITSKGLRRTEALSDEQARPVTTRDVLLVSVILALFLGFSVVVTRSYILPMGQQLADNRAAQEAQTSDTQFAPANELPRDSSVAVLPLANLSPDPDNAYFAAGVHDELSNQLAKINALRVVSRSSTLPYANTGLAPLEVASRLNVSNLVEGSVRFADNRVRVSVQLIRASDGTQLWAETFERTLDDIFAIQTEIAVQVAEALQASILPSELADISLVATESADAYSLFLHSRYLQENAPPDDYSYAWLAAAIDDVRQAISIDPDFALGYAELGALLYRSWEVSPALNQERLLNEAEFNANEAQDINPASAEKYDLLPALTRAFEVLADINFERRDWAAWEDYSRQMLAMASGNAEAESWFGYRLGLLGRFDEANRQHEVAIALEPSNPELLRQAALTRIFQGDYDSALELLDRFRLVGGELALFNAYSGYITHFDGGTHRELGSSERSALLDTVAFDTLGYPLTSFHLCRLGLAEALRTRMGSQNSEYKRNMAEVACAIGEQEANLATEWLSPVLGAGRNAYLFDAWLEMLSASDDWSVLQDNVALIGG